MLSQLINTAKQDTIHLDAIRLDGGTQPRAGINEEYVDELAEAIQAGATLPPIDVIYDGDAYWLYDGFHRVAAHRKADYRLVPANIHQGTQADAQWRSYAANQTHGLRRSQADKERAIRAALKHPSAVGQADAAIARHLGVSDKTVTKYRQDMEASSEIPKISERTVQRGDTTYTMRTANIGANQPPRRHIYDGELERIVVAWAAEHYPGDWPENPSHTNGTYWQQLTAYLRATITAATWHESDLKAIIKRLHAQRRAPSPQSPISNPSPYKSLAQMDADGEIPPLAPRPSQPNTYASVFAIQSNLRALTASATAADLRTTATHRGGSRWFEARRLLQAAVLHYRDRDLVQALNNLADELEQRDRTQPSTQSTDAPRPTLTTAEAADLLRPTIDDFYAKVSASRRYRINDMRACAQSTIGNFWFACERTLANYTYTLALLANAISLLADELEQSEPSTDAPALFDYEIDDALAELVQQANASLDGQIQSVFAGSATYWAEQVSQALQKPVTYQRMALAIERLMRTLQEQRAEQPGFVPLQMAQPSTPSIPSTPAPEPDDRINRARILINHYQELRTACEDILQREREYEALVGTPSDLLAAHRGMHAIVDTLTEPIAKLEHLVETLITTRYESR